MINPKQFDQQHNPEERPPVNQAIHVFGPRQSPPVQQGVGPTFQAVQPTQTSGNGLLWLVLVILVIGGLWFISRGSGQPSQARSSPVSEQPSIKRPNPQGLAETRTETTPSHPAPSEQGPQDSHPANQPTQQPNYQPRIQSDQSPDETDAGTSEPKESSPRQPVYARLLGLWSGTYECMFASGYQPSIVIDFEVFEVGPGHIDARVTTFTTEPPPKARYHINFDPFSKEFSATPEQILYAPPGFLPILGKASTNYSSIVGQVANPCGAMTLERPKSNPWMGE